MKEVIITETNHTDAQFCILEDTNNTKKECSNIIIREGDYLYGAKG